MIVETSGWRHLKEKNKFFLSYEYHNIYQSSPKTASLPKIAPNKKWKTLSLSYVLKSPTILFPYHKIIDLNIYDV